jgi:beta-lactamase class A
MKKQHYIFISGLITALIVGYTVGCYLHYHAPDAFNESRLHDYSSAQLTNPLLECAEQSEEILIGDRAKIEKTVQTYVDKAITQGVVTDAAIYFRDLNNGPWFGINERDKFTPGSLLKLPLTMSYYWREDRERHVLDEVIEVVKLPDNIANESNYGSDAPLVPGVYSVRDLIGYMLKESSNDAAAVLADVAGKSQIKSTYEDLGIESPTMGQDYEIDVKTFGAFLRVLYNASYIGQPGSEELLATLTQVSFRDGLVAGVPSNIKVAHKFGTRVIGTGAGSRQLHDCGIVYAPKTPYVLCVMTRGNESKNLSYFIAEVSKRVYNGVTNE